jgi:hypothetical protein
VSQSKESATARADIADRAVDLASDIRELRAGTHCLQMLEDLGRTSR